MLEKILYRHLKKKRFFEFRVSQNIFFYWKLKMEFCTTLYFCALLQVYTGGRWRGSNRIYGAQAHDWPWEGRAVEWAGWSTWWGRRFYGLGTWWEHNGATKSEQGQSTRWKSALGSKMHCLYGEPAGNDTAALQARLSVWRLCRENKQNVPSLQQKNWREEGCIPSLISALHV